MIEAGQNLRGGRYVVLGVLGEGSQGATLDAVDKRDGRLVAIKRFQVKGARSWKDVELAEREASVIRDLSHPLLPAHVEHFEEGGALYLAMEKIDGEDLGAVRRRGGTFGREEVVRLLHDAATVLEYLHGRSPPVIHRDIKPSNLIRRADTGGFVLVDFGSVRAGLRPAGGSTVAGTFGYMAPEQFQGRAGPASDVYGVGVTALTLLTGIEPEDMPHRGLAIDVRATLAAGMRDARDEALIRVLEAMLEVDPDRRASRIGPLLATLPLAPPPSAPRRQTPSDPPSERRKRKGNRRDRRRDEKRQRRRERREQDAARRAAKQRRAADLLGAAGLEETDIPPLVRVLFVLGLTLARVAVSLSLQVAVPLLLNLVSLVAGKGPRRAAKRVREAGKRADAAMQRAQVRVRRGAAAAAAVAEQRARGPRIDEPAGDEPVRVRVEAEDLHDADDAMAELEQSIEDVKRQFRRRR